MNLPNALQNGPAGRYLQAQLCRSYLNMEAVFSDETASFVAPNAPNPGDTCTLRLRTAKDNVDAAYLHTGGQALPMAKSGQGNALFDYYEAALTVPNEPMRYHFSVEKDGQTLYYTKQGLYEQPNPDFFFRIVPGFYAPEWAKGAVMYQIFVDRFHNGDRANDPVDNEYEYLGRLARKKDWGDTVAADDICNFYGGDLQGIMDKMGYLQDLGVQAIYLNPLFVSPSSHKYDIQDYDHVDPHFGRIVTDGDYKTRTAAQDNLDASNALFAAMITCAHQHGIKVILDGVFNHCGSFNKWLDRAGVYAAMDYPHGAFWEEDSPYRKYFLWHKENWPNNSAYDSWWGNENHPKLNYEDAPALYHYMMHIAQKWLSPPYNADGWRLDVAADVGRSPAFNHQFWQDFRKAAKTANPNALILAEHYGDPSSWLSGGEWDTVMNYDAFMEPLTWFLTGVNKHSEEAQPALYCNAMAFENAMRFHMARFNVQALHTAMNQLSNHDHSRFLTRTHRQTGRLHTHGTHAAEAAVNKSIMMEAVVFQMTWPGAPTLYYGDEAGLCGWTDPDNRRPFPWGDEDPALMAVHKAAIALRRQHAALRTGSVEFLFNNCGILSFGRWVALPGDTVSPCFAVALNNHEAPHEVCLPVWKMGLTQGTMRCVLATYDGVLQTLPNPFAVLDGTVTLNVPAHGAMVLQSV